MIAIGRQWPGSSGLRCRQRPRAPAGRRLGVDWSPNITPQNPRPIGTRHHHKPRPGSTGGSERANAEPHHTRPWHACDTVGHIRSPPRRLFESRSPASRAGAAPPTRAPTPAELGLVRPIRSSLSAGAAALGKDCCRAVRWAAAVLPSAAAADRLRARARGKIALPESGVQASSLATRRTRAARARRGASRRIGGARPAPTSAAASAPPVTAVNPQRVHAAIADP